MSANASAALLVLALGAGCSGDGGDAVRDWMKTQGFAVTYKEVNADHAGMVPLVLPDVFTFFDQVK